ncbi:type II secretion system F family protein [Candidatus Saccharibacteria bacterium]|nr:type II secretion system F family protein [Candidatus Saccharibacteria bacterium]
MKFNYKAKARDGRIINGSIETSNREAVVEFLEKQGAKPISIHEAGVTDQKGGTVKKGGLFKPKVKLRELVVFTRQLSTMVSAGVPLPRALSTLEQQTENKYFKAVIVAINRDVEAGIALADAFAKHPDVFSEVYVSMVRAGEAGGILDDILKRLAMQTEKDAAIRKKIKSAMTYPTVILAITVLAFFGLMIFVIPKLGDIIRQMAGPDASLPVYTQVLLDMTDFALSATIIPGVPNMVFIVGALGLAGYFALRYIRTPKGKYQFHSLLLRVPVLKNVIVKVAISRFARTFASLASAGVAVLDALEVTGNAIGNKVIQQEIAAAAKEVQNGKPLSEALASGAHIPPIVPQMMAVGEETGQIDAILVKVADFYDEEVDTLIGGLSSLIEPLMIVVLGGIVGLIAASVMGPIASLSEKIQG